MKLQLYQNYKRIIDNYESFTEYMGGQSLDIDLEMKDIKMFRKPRPRIENSYLITYLLTANNVAGIPMFSRHCYDNSVIVKKQINNN